MSPEKRSEIARKGGRSVKPENRSFSRDPALASSAGRKGGVSISPKKRAFAMDKDLASSAGRKGGLSKKAKAKAEEDFAAKQIDLEDYLKANREI